MSPLTVLITNMVLLGRSGTETYVHDLALGLRARGHRVMIYCPSLGETSRQIAAAGVEVVDDPRRLSARPDIIHGQHNTETMTALLHFAGVPALFMCHDSNAWHDAPPRFPRIGRYLAVDDNCRDRLLREGISQDHITVVRNAVDLQRFQPRPPLPNTPARALVFSNYADEKTHLPAVREACRQLQLPVDVVGSASGRSVARPEEILGNYDLVFAKARCAMEAMAAGCAVVLCDFEGVGGMVNLARFDELQRLNFGRRALTRPIDPRVLLEEIGRYHAADATAVSRRLRETASLDAMVDRLLDLYRGVIDRAARNPSEPASELAAASGFFHLISRQLNCCFFCSHEKLQLEAARTQAETIRAATIDELEDARAHGRDLQARLDADLASRFRRFVRRTFRRGKNPPPMPFIIGVPRSGTTLLRMILDAHSQLSIPPETGFIPYIVKISGAPDTRREQVFQTIINSHNWADFHLPVDEYRRAVWALKPFTAAEAVRAFYRLYAARHGKRRVGDKTPTHSQDLNKIEALLPEAFFIHIIRDGRAVARSLRDKPFSPSRDYRVLAAYWRDQILETRRQGRHSPRYIEVRYEELIRNTAAVLREICRRLELPFEKGMLDYHHRSADRLAQHEARSDADGRVTITREDRFQSQRLVTLPPQPDRIDSWKTEISPADQREFTQVAGDFLKQLNYEA